LAIKRKAGAKILGLAADPKPTAAAEPLNTIFHETDTHNEYINNGSAWVLYRAASKTETLTNKTFDNDLNTAKLPFYSIIVYKSGITYKAKNMHTGAVLATTSTTDAAAVITDAANNMPLKSQSLGGTIGITGGTFPCLTELTINAASTATHGINIVGAGKGATVLNWAPGSALTNAIKFKIHDSGLYHVKVTANANVTNIINIDGNGQKGVIDNCIIQGATAAPPTAGQIGVLDAPGTSATYYWRFLNSQFNQVDIGIKVDNTTTPANAAFFDNLDFININGGIYLVGSNMHAISNCFMQASGTVGDYLLRITGAAAFDNKAYGLEADTMSKAGSFVVKLESGATMNVIHGVGNTGTGGRVSDTSGGKNYLRTGIYANLASQTPGASPYTYTNTSGSLQEVTVGGGTVSQILFIRAPDTGGVLTGCTTGVFALESGDGLKITYSVAPTMLRIGH
jgi:hypothetical protein